MAGIVLAEIVGTRMAEEGSGGYTVNSTSYSVLAFYSDGSRKLFEGSANQISWLLPYVKPRSDVVELRNLLLEFGKNLKKDVQDAIHSELARVEMSRSPVPEIRGKDRFEARNIVKEAGLDFSENGGISESVSGTVVGYERNDDDPKTVILIIRYDIPTVNGMDFSSAVAKLQGLGFTVKHRKVKVDNASQQDKVFGMDYNSGPVVILNIGDHTGGAFFSELLKDETSMLSIWNKWEASDLRAGHPQTTEEIRKQKEFERLYGRQNNIDQMKKKLENIYYSEG